MSYTHTKPAPPVRSKESSPVSSSFSSTNYNYNYNYNSPSPVTSDFSSLQNHNSPSQQPQPDLNESHPPSSSNDLGSIMSPQYQHQDVAGSYPTQPPGPSSQTSPYQNERQARRPSHSQKKMQSTQDDIQRKRLTHRQLIRSQILHSLIRMKKAHYLLLQINII